MDSIGGMAYMADQRLTSLTAITSAADGDVLYIVDVSDTTDNAAGSSKKIVLSDLIANHEYVGTQLKDYSLTANALGNVTGSTSIDLTLGNYITATATGVVTWSFTNPPSTSIAGGFVLVLTNGGAYTQNWPAGVKWPAGTAPTLTASGIDVLMFLTDDAGTTWRGVASMIDSR